MTIEDNWGDLKILDISQDHGNVKDGTIDDYDYDINFLVIIIIIIIIRTHQRKPRVHEHALGQSRSNATLVPRSLER